MARMTASNRVPNRRDPQVRPTTGCGWPHKLDSCGLAQGLFPDGLPQSGIFAAVVAVESRDAPLPCCGSSTLRARTIAGRSAREIHEAAQPEQVFQRPAISLRSTIGMRP